ncbi:hypothetical protein V1478_016031 [Vespula squamosa]|uniref:Uncharacterized protein n=1 Tax=Vespula squamosa TaxID=30214 RepID=A0ABD2A362_VESSQ
MDRRTIRNYVEILQRANLCMIMKNRSADALTFTRVYEFSGEDPSLSETSVIVPQLCSTKEIKKHHYRPARITLVHRPLKSTKVDIETLLGEISQCAAALAGGRDKREWESLLITVRSGVTGPREASAFLRRLVKCPWCSAPGNIFRLRLIPAKSDKTTAPPCYGQNCNQPTILNEATKSAMEIANPLRKREERK